jgi:diacylglycerol kinase family enzyme
LGTANNLARTLGFAVSPQQIIARLESGKKRVLDVGLARGPRGKRFFFEAAGGGLLADYVRSAKGTSGKSKNLSKKQQITRHVSSLRQMLDDYAARKWNIELDGEDISGRYILWEAMNIRSVGPALCLAASASTKDGRFDLVCVDDRGRSALTKYLDARVAGQKTTFPLPIRRFRQLKVIFKKSTIHLDDRFWPRKKATAKRSERNCNQCETIGPEYSPSTGTKKATGVASRRSLA